MRPKTLSSFPGDLVLARLNTCLFCLDHAEASRRQKEFGPNEI